MNKDSKIYVAGHNGMVGSACWRLLKKEGYKNLIGKSSNELDLRNQNEVFTFFEIEKPDIVIDAAAKVGGILANNTLRVEFLTENLKINMNILESVISNNNIKVINLGSSCIYPLNAKNPISEMSLMTGELEPTNSPYAMAKLTSIELGNAISKQYGIKIINLMPTNLYGPNDNFNSEFSHVIPG